MLKVHIPEDKLYKWIGIISYVEAEVENKDNKSGIGLYELLSGLKYDITETMTRNEWS